ncbi:MAG: hypothetical protein RI935_302 [Candidatus Parcubacteria bacterium]|jgi:hypothetical protein
MRVQEKIYRRGEVPELSVPKNLPHNMFEVNVKSHSQEGTLMYR